MKQLGRTSESTGNHPAPLPRNKRWSGSRRRHHRLDQYRPRRNPLRGASSTTTGAGRHDATSSNDAGVTSNAYPPSGAFESTGRGAFAVTGGDDAYAYAARTSVTDIVGPAGDVKSGSFANGCTVESRSRTRDVDGEDTVAPDTDGNCPDPPLGLIVARYDRGSPPDLNTSGCSAHSRRKAFHAATAAVTSNNPTGGSRAALKTAFANGAVPTTAADSTGEVDTRTATVGDAATITDYVAVGQVSPDVTSEISPAAATDAPPPFDMDATLWYWRS